MLDTMLKSFPRLVEVLCLPLLERGQAKLILRTGFGGIDLCSVAQLNDGFSIFAIFGVGIGFCDVGGLLRLWIGTVGRHNQHPYQHERAYPVRLGAAIEKHLSGLLSRDDANTHRGVHSMLGYQATR